MTDLTANIPIEVSVKDAYMQKISNAAVNGKTVDYIKTHPQNPNQQVEVDCKKCGDPIRLTTTDVNGRLILNTLSNYVELTILCDDGSRHVTNCCTKCAVSLTSEDLNDFLIIDARQMLAELITADQKISDSFVNVLINRSVVEGQ